jgi:hypothetical protein
MTGPQQRRSGRVLRHWVAVRGKITVFAVGAVMGTGFAPGTAGAQQGLTVDPQSPAGVEYAVPLDTARSHGGGGSSHPGSGGGGSTSGGSGTGGSGSPVLFGSGITPPAKAASRSGSGSGGQGSGARKRQSGGRGSKPGARTATAGSPSPVTPVTASASYSSTGPVAGIVGGVLLLGGGFGLFVRLRGRRSASPR